MLYLNPEVLTLPLSLVPWTTKAEVVDKRQVMWGLFSARVAQKSIYVQIIVMFRLSLCHLQSSTQNGIVDL